eukprot:6688707-Prymnesium_polylepis.1
MKVGPMPAAPARQAERGGCGIDACAPVWQSSRAFRRRGCRALARPRACAASRVRRRVAVDALLAQGLRRRALGVARVVHDPLSGRRAHDG